MFFSYSYVNLKCDGFDFVQQQIFTYFEHKKSERNSSSDTKDSDVYIKKAI